MGSLPTRVVDHAPGSASLSLTHAGNAYPGSVDRTGHFSTPARVRGVIILHHFGDRIPAVNRARVASSISTPAMARRMLCGISLRGEQLPVLAEGLADVAQR